MIRGSSLRWRLVAWVAGVMLVVFAIVFVIVYEQTGSQLRAQVNQDLTGDVSQLSEAVSSLRPSSSAQLAGELRRYVSGQPYGTSSLLFAVVPGHGAVSNHPELFGGYAEDGESIAQAHHESALAGALLTGAVGRRTAQVADVGAMRLDERIVTAGRVRVRVGAGESLQAVTRAQRSVARAFALAGSLALVLVLIGSYLAGASVSRPLRRMARVAARVDDGDLGPRMIPSPSASREIRVLAESFNHMLDRLAVAFAHQREFVADASHELRTPLTVIAGQLEVLATAAHPSADEIRRTQRLVAAEVARTSRLVDDMLLLTRSEHQDFLRRQAIVLEDFIADLWATTTAGHDRSLELGRVPGAVLDADPDRLAQALRNLIDNALAHTTGPAGRVSLHTEALADGWVRFTVADDGPGIPAPERERVFERFHRTDEARDRVVGGAGLGLAIVQAIAQAHGGRARAARPDGDGARLVLEIPGLRPAPTMSRDRVPARPYGRGRG